MDETDGAEEARALAALNEAVAAVGAAFRARRRRDALLAVHDGKLANMAERVARAFGFSVFIVGGSAEAAATVAGRSFDLIILEARDHPAFWARRIRTLPGGRAEAAIIVLGGVADGDAHWIDGYVSPPVNAARLVELIALLMGARADAARREA